MPTSPLLAAIYFGDWHVDAQMSAVHGANWTEWSLPQRATPRFPGHVQPNLPLEDEANGFGVGVSEDAPAVMARKIEAAVANGIGMFLFDWYWYASPTMGGVPDLQGAGGGPFLSGALDSGFLKAPNRAKMEFALMWANQDWVDVHPAKRGWHGTYRASPDVPPIGPGADPNMLLMFDGYMSAQVYRNAFAYIAKTYFTQPNYYRAPTRLANGTVAQCCFFSMYQPQYMAPGNASLGAQLADDFRAAAEAVGQCLHLNHMTSPDALLTERRADSRTDYGWMKLGEGGGFSFPSTPYETVAAHAWRTMVAAEAKYAAPPYRIPYVPVLSVGWDPSPRTLPSDGWGEFGYPWGISWRSNASQWAAQLARAKQHMASRCRGGGEWCPPLLINAWNEWSEGAYLEPDQREGTAKLAAIGRVFGPAASRDGSGDGSVVASAAAARAVPSTPPQTKVSVGAIRWDAWFGSREGRGGIVGRTVTQDLSPARFHDRLPFFATEHAFDPATNSTVSVDGNSTAVLLAENAHAAAHGIGYWAFCAYPLTCSDDDPPPASCPMIQCCADNAALSYALLRYLELPRPTVNFSLILQAGAWWPTADYGGDESLDEEAARYAAYFARPTYQKVLTARPIVFVLGLGRANATRAAAALHALRRAAVAALGAAGNPYVVAMAGTAASAASLVSQFGLDAASSYVNYANPTLAAGAPFASSIAEPEASLWEDMAEAGLSVVPPISVGWDPSPREYIDLPWGDQGHVACVEKLGHPCFVRDPTMDELENHTAAAVRFAVARRANATSAASVLISAWNENDEGHWVVPSLRHGTRKLEAVRRGLARGAELP